MIGIKDFTGLKRNYSNLGRLVLVGQDEREALAPLRSLSHSALSMVVLSLLWHRTGEPRWHSTMPGAVQMLCSGWLRPIAIPRPNAGFFQALTYKLYRCTPAMIGIRLRIVTERVQMG